MIDVNDPPTSISLLSKGIYENATAGTVVGVLQAQDEDANQSHYFQLISSQGMFRITGYSLTKAGLYVEAALKVQVFTTTSYNPGQTSWENLHFWRERTSHFKISVTSWHFVRCLKHFRPGMKLVSLSKYTFSRHATLGLVLSPSPIPSYRISSTVR